MEVAALLAVAMMAGVAIGIVIAQWRYQFEFEQKLKRWHEDSKTEMAKLAEVHNSLAKAVAAMQDGVNKHEMMLGMRGK